MNKIKWNIEKMVDLSFYHVQEEDWDLMQLGGESHDDYLRTRVIAHVCDHSGFLLALYFDNDEEVDNDLADYTKEFRDLVKMLVVEGFDFLRVDTDGTTHPELPVYDVGGWGDKHMKEWRELSGCHA